jgi:hypothetical protein
MFLLCYAFYKAHGRILNDRVALCIVHRLTF